jgi:DNA-binding PadR family transcriptional regulator
MRYALLALLAQGITHGYELKQAFERLFAPVWPPVNIGQIYTTLARLERDGLVVSRDVEQTGRPNKRVYQLTDEGRGELGTWMNAPIAGTRLKDEFFMKLLLGSVAGTDPLHLLDRQRSQYLQSLRDLDALALDTPAESPAQLLIEGAMLHLQADLKWLDRCEERISNGLGPVQAGGAPATEMESDSPTGQGLPEATEED